MPNFKQLLEKPKRRKKTEQIKNDNLKKAGKACQEIAKLKKDLEKNANTLKGHIKDNEDVLDECLENNGFNPRSVNANKIVADLKKQYDELKNVRDKINTQLKTIDDNLHIDQNTN